MTRKSVTDRELVREIEPHIKLYRDPATGLAWVENGRAGCGHSCHPNMAASGSLLQRSAREVYGPDARLVTSHGFIYNTSMVVGEDEYDEIARQHCQCGGNHEK